MPFQEVNGIQIYYEEQGQGEPLLMIQGLGYPGGMWFLQAPFLSRHFRTIIFDNRGVGKTDRPNDEYTVALMAADAVGLLEALGIRRAHIAGVSLGGYIAQEMALSRPEIVDRLVLMATSCGSVKYAEMTRELWKEIAALAGLPAEEIFRRGMALAAARGFSAAFPDLIERSVALRMVNPQPFYAFTRQFNAAMVFDSCERAHLIRHPTLLMAGAQDRVMPLPLSEELAARIPQAQFKVFPDAGHLLFLEKADEVNQEIVRFLNK